MLHQSDTDGLSTLVQGMYAYLTELDTYRSICLRHELTASIRVEGDALCVSRTFTLHFATVTCLKNCSNRCPGWEFTPYWGLQRSEWDVLKKHIDAQMRENSKVRAMGTLGIAWDHRPMLINPFILSADAKLVVELILPRLASPLPELPLRAVAQALRCHEYLVPAAIATPLPMPTSDREWGIRAYLQRAMPQDLIASQCFRHNSAEKSPSDTVAPGEAS
jgi:hypothetical protein